MTRPGNLLPGVIEGLGLECLNPEKPDLIFFGNWEWIIPKDQRAHYMTVRETVKERITELYRRGAIRYGSW